MKGFCWGMLVVCLLPSGAWAASGMEFGVQDDALLSSASGASTASEWRSSGFSTARINAIWRKIAPSPMAQQKPTGFTASNPNSAGYAWQSLDASVANAQSSGLKIVLTITGPGPDWAQHNGRRGGVYKPSIKEFKRFSAAVATRYRGKIAHYSIWNEPNFPGWLQPQAVCTSTCKPYAPHYYRRIVRSVYPVLKRIDPSATVLAGVLASVGRSLDSGMTSIKPLAFWRAFGCVNSSYRAIRTGLCKNFKAATIDDAAHNPHSVKNPPDQPSSDRDFAQFGDLQRLEHTLDRLTGLQRIRRAAGGELNLYLIEFGYQTNPPDAGIGVSLDSQSSWLQQAIRIAVADPRIRNLTLYVWQDEANLGGWQSGLKFSNGSKKPAFDAIAELLHSLT